MTTPIAIEFPDYDVSTLPTIPVGFVDESWHNDACPCFVKGTLQLFIDYADPAMRECGTDAPRYALLRTVDVEPVVLCQSNEWADILAAITSFEAKQ
jgi:hypothetical protein